MLNLDSTYFYYLLRNYIKQNKSNYKKLGIRKYFTIFIERIG